jgi:hypothetical protein
LYILHQYFYLIFFRTSHIVIFYYSSAINILRRTVPTIFDFINLFWVNLFKDLTSDDTHTHASPKLIRYSNTNVCKIRVLSSNTINDIRWVQQRVLYIILWSTYLSYSVIVIIEIYKIYCKYYLFIKLRLITVATVDKGWF